MNEMDKRVLSLDRAFWSGFCVTLPGPLNCRDWFIQKQSWERSGLDLRCLRNVVKTTSGLFPGIGCHCCETKLFIAQMRSSWEKKINIYFSPL